MIWASFDNLQAIWHVCNVRDGGVQRIKRCDWRLWRFSAQKQQKSNVINYKHEPHALAYTCLSSQLADLNVLAHIFLLRIYNINVCCVSASAYTTLNRVYGVFFYIICTVYNSCQRSLLHQSALTSCEFYS